MFERGYFDAGIVYGDQTVFITALDYAILPLYVAFVYLVYIFVRTLFVRDPSIRGYFMLGLTAKLVGAFTLGMVYQYYYVGGDTTLYFWGGKVVYTAFKTDFSYVQAIYRSSAGNPDPLISNLTWYIPYFKDPNGFFTDKVMGFFVTPSFGLYLPSAILNAAFWYPGSWLMFITFRKILPGKDRLVAISTLFVPSLVFWGSGILKDTITLSALGTLTYGLYHGFILRQQLIKNIFFVLIGCFFIINVKSYILLSFAPGAIMWIIINWSQNIKSAFLKRTITPLLFILSFVGSAIILTQASGAFEKYSIQNALETASAFQQWHSYLAENENASGYSLGVGGTGNTAILINFLPAVGTTLFRPFLWEVRNPVMAISSLESFIFLVVTLRILLRVGLRTFFKEIFNNPFLFFCLFFFMLFGFAVGFTAYNFGALVRYKIPCIPFYAIFLIILNDRSLIIKNERDKEANYQKALRQIKIDRNRRKILTSDS